MATVLLAARDTADARTALGFIAFRSADAAHAADDSVAARAGVVSC
jgi:hypothetical protein